MSTRAFVPRLDGEGSLGTTLKKWGNIYADAATINAAPVGYPLQVIVSAAWGPTVSQTVYFGGIGRAPNTTEGYSRVYIPTAGTVVAATIHLVALTITGDAVNWTMNFRHGAASTLIQTAASAAANKVWTNLAMSKVVAAGDYFEIESVNQTSGTTPTGCYLSGTVYIKI